MKAKIAEINLSPLAGVMFALFAIYLWIYPFSMYLLVTGTVPPATEWMASLMLVLVGLVATLWVMLNYGSRRGFSAAFAVLVGGFTVEFLGVSTGFPFGEYFYTDALSPKLLVVPIGITFAWLMMILSSFFMAQFIVARLWKNRGIGTVACLAVALALLADLLMEPVATQVQGYWTWIDRGAYYGVPTSNFIAWGIISVALIMLLARIIGLHRPVSPTKESFRYIFIPIALYLMNLVMFGAINLSYRYYLAAGIGVVVLAGCAVLIWHALNAGRKPLAA